VEKPFVFPESPLGWGKTEEKHGKVQRIFFRTLSQFSLMRRGPSFEIDRTSYIENLIGNFEQI